ncbi:uncharacterized protein LOC142620554 [Castanea sativa]|uniref:uncharacterized protein LOC142620554 n=1 Tax=Castanea sativa TaxID=21020 RepID=UPI003F64D73B
MALKLDISKAYNRVEWVCLDKIMEKLRFGVKWRGFIMQCVSTVTYSIKINGIPRGNIIPSTGVCQGDHLSPYLFLLCAEGLSLLIKSSVASGVLEGVVVCRNGPKLSQLFFAGNSLIFCKASLTKCDALQQALKVYEQASGQQLNRAKTSLFFSRNTPLEIQEEIKQRFGAQVIKQHEKYLGCDFVEASLGNNPSFSWRSIMSAQKLVRGGIRWRVGNGKDIHIWGDKWLPSLTTFRLASPRQFPHQDTRVSELIDHATTSCKFNILDALFLPHEAEMIKGIPISSRLPADKLIWVEASNGKFSVKSAYGLAMRLAAGADQSISSDRSQDQICDECRENDETTDHLLWSCPKAKEVWSFSKLAVSPSHARVNTFFDLLWGVTMKERGDEDVVAKLVCTAWAIWHNRNVTRHGGQQRNGNELIRWVA